MIGRRSIRMICAGRPAPRRVLRSRGLTVVAAPADTDYTIRLENVGTGLAHGRPRRPGTDRPRHDRLPSPKLPSLCARYLHPDLRQRRREQGFSAQKIRDHDRLP
jgi:hypothetical protein